MKKTNALAALIILFIGHLANAQDDPFKRLKEEAAKNGAIKKTGANKITVKTEDPVYKLNGKPPVEFKPFTLVDKNGKAIPPSQIVTLKNGTKMTAQDYVTAFNDYEKKFNATGHSFRNDKQVTISKVVTDKQYLDDKVPLFPKILRPRLSPAEVTDLMGYTNKFGDYVIKPTGQMTQADRINNKQLNFSVKNNKIQTQHTTAPKPRNKQNTSLSDSKYSNVLVQSLPYKWEPVNMNLGSKSTVYVGIDLGFSSDLEIYSPNLTDSEKNHSFYKATANASIACALFGNEFDIFKANATLNAPADRTKKMSASCVVTILGDNVVNESDNDLRKVMSDNKSEGFDQQYSISIPIWDGINFDGEVGVSGDIGVKYSIGPPENGIEDFGATFSVGPIAELDGYAQVGVDFLGIVGVGVGGNLTVFQGDISINNSTYVANLYTPDITPQIPVTTDFSVDYGITMLSGDLYVYAQECIPFLSWFSDDACLQQTADIFSWSGYNNTGTIAQESNSYVLTVAYALPTDMTADDSILNIVPQDQKNIIRAYTVNTAATSATIPPGGSGYNILIFYKNNNKLEQASLFGDIIVSSKLSSEYLTWMFDSYENSSAEGSVLRKQDSLSLNHLLLKAGSAYTNFSAPASFTLTALSNDQAAKAAKNIEDKYNSFLGSELK